MASDCNLLSGKTAVITGCNRGIGKAVLEAFSANGANIFACVRKENIEFSRFIEQLSEKNSVNIFPVYFDAGNVDEIKSGVKEIMASNRPVDILVNNAGIGYSALFQMSGLDKLKEVFDVNFIAPFVLTQYMVKSMVRQKSGSIINIASIAGIEGACGRSVYGSSKAALMCMTRVVAAELGGMGIRANSIAPGLTDTEMLSGMPKEAIAEILDKLSIKRIGKPSEVADIAVFLASDLSSFVTGQVIRVDGGAI
ncbi:MAG: SDR family NAD(P)-dependent oxidoreductase [Bacteroidales bacterium]